MVKITKLFIPLLAFLLGSAVQARPMLWLSTAIAAQADDELPDGDLDLPDGDFDEDPTVEDQPGDDDAAQTEPPVDKAPEQPKPADSDMGDDAIIPGPSGDDLDDKAGDGAVPPLEPIKPSDGTEDAVRPRPEDLQSPWEEEDARVQRPVGSTELHQVEVGGTGRVGAADEERELVEEPWFWGAVGGGSAVVIAAGVGTGFLVYNMLNADKGSVTIVLE